MVVSWNDPGIRLDYQNVANKGKGLKETGDKDLAALCLSCSKYGKESVMDTLQDLQNRSPEQIVGLCLYDAAGQESSLAALPNLRANHRHVG